MKERDSVALKGKKNFLQSRLLPVIKCEQLLDLTRQSFGRLSKYFLRMSNHKEKFGNIFFFISFCLPLVTFVPFGLNWLMVLDDGCVEAK